MKKGYLVSLALGGLLFLPIACSTSSPSTPASAPTATPTISPVITATVTPTGTIVPVTISMSLNTEAVSHNAFSGTLSSPCSNGSFVWSDTTFSGTSAVTTLYLSKGVTQSFALAENYPTGATLTGQFYLAVSEPSLTPVTIFGADTGSGGGYTTHQGEMWSIIGSSISATCY